MSAERRADVPAPRAGPRSLSLAWVEREEGCNKVREFRWLSSKGSLTTSPLLVCPSLFLLSLSLSSLPFRLGKPIRSKTTLFRPPPPPLSPLPEPSLPPHPSRDATEHFAEARRAKEAKKAAATATSTTQPGSARNSRPSTPGPTATAKPSGSSMSIKKVPTGHQQQASLPPPVPAPVNALRADMEAMGLGAPESAGSLLQVERAQKQAQRQRQQEEDEDTTMTTTNGADDDAPVLSIAKEKILEEVRAKEKTEKPVLSLVVVGKCFPKTRLGCDALRGSHGRAPCQQVMSTQASRP